MRVGSRSGRSATVATLSLVAVLLQAACAPAAPPAAAPAPTTAAKPAEAAKPADAAKPAEAAKPAPAAAPSGTLRVALNGEPPTLDPAVANDLSSSPLSANLYTTLIATDPTGKLVPRLAES